MTPTEIEQLRGLTDGASEYTDQQLQDLFVAEGTMAATARWIWRTKAATYAGMVNISESGSSRSLGDLHKNALAMAASFEKDEAIVPATGIKRSRKAVRR